MDGLHHREERHRVHRTSETCMFKFMSLDAFFMMDACEEGGKIDNNGNYPVTVPLISPPELSPLVPSPGTGSGPNGVEAPSCRMPPLST